MGVKAAEVTLAGGEAGPIGSVLVNTELVPALQSARLAYALKVTDPKTVKLVRVRFTVAVSVAELPNAMGVGETFVVIDAFGQVFREPTAKSCRSAVADGEDRVSKRNLFTHGSLPTPNIPERSIPTSKKSPGHSWPVGHLAAA